MIESFKLPTITPETLTGSIVSFNDEYGGLPLKSCTSLISGYQEGSGTPSPSNVRNLVSFNSATLTENGNTYTFTFGQSIYSGSIDWKRGVVVGTWGYIASYNGETLTGEWLCDKAPYEEGTTPPTGSQVAYELAEPIEIPLGGINLLTQEGVNNIFADCGNTTLTRIDFRNTVYGFNIDYTNKTVTYLGDAVGMTPAYMNYTSGKFNYGSWRDAFFMPRPCMLRSNGTVAYYLDENDYTKRADGTASDVGDFSFDGNAMMEWGQKGKRIFYKQVNEADGTISVYIADEQVDPDYHCWSFYDANGNLKDHFYTPIYNGTLDTNGKLRSISGKDYTNYCKYKTGAQEVTAAELNNVGTDKGWYTEVNADWILMCHLLTLMSKSLDSSTAFGKGRTGQNPAESNMLTTGSMNDKGLFWGSNTGTYGVKVFGMENQWGNQWRRMAGLVLNNNKWYYKLTRYTVDGSVATDYNSDGTNYITHDGHTAPTDNYVQEMYYTGDGAFYDKVTNSTADNTMYRDYFYDNASGARYTLRGGGCPSSAVDCGACYVFATYYFTYMSWNIGASLAYK